MPSQIIRRHECTRCHAEVREGKKKHFCGEGYPLKAHDEIKTITYVPAVSATAHEHMRVIVYEALLSEWLEQGAAMGAGSRSDLTERTLDALANYGAARAA